MFTRRGFIRIGAASVGSLALRPLGLLPALAQSQLAADIYLAATMESLQDVFDVFFPAIHASGMQSFSYNQRVLKDGTPAFTVSLLNSYRLSDKPSSQRRRTRKIIPTYYQGGAF